MKPAQGWQIALALAAVYLLWGSTYLAIKVALPGYPPFLLAAIRMEIAAALMLAWLLWRGARWPSAAQWRNLVWLSVFMVPLSNALVNFAEVHVSSGLAAIAVAAMPLWAGVFAALRGHHPTGREWLGLAIGFLGVVGLNLGSELGGSLPGLLALLVAPVAWAWGSIWSKGRDLPEPFMLAATQMLVGGVFAAIIGLASGERLHALPALEPTLAMLYLAVAGSILGFTAYVWLLHHVRPALATSYAYVNPPIAVALGALLAAERFGAGSLVAMAVIGLGVLLITTAKKN
jgi:drug/metabolite transporter (DMT)-like permease